MENERFDKDYINEGEIYCFESRGVIKKCDCPVKTRDLRSLNWCIYCCYNGEDLPKFLGKVRKWEECGVPSLSPAFQIPIVVLCPFDEELISITKCENCKRFKTKDEEYVYCELGIMRSVPEKEGDPKVLFLEKEIMEMKNTLEIKLKTEEKVIHIPKWSLEKVVNLLKESLELLNKK